MENLIVFNDVNLIGKDNNNVFSAYATKYFLYLIDDYSVMDDLNNCTSLCTRNKNGEIIERWQLQNMEDKDVPF